ncbi:hypothetical protein Lfu02_01210 [Longispora fulva]|uniref:Uncharacterized protein n=1 Tax=Longispora fulva TaxID=619741 RepID=A0A8J7GDP9_9ACTN|nr:hypothetical protein [Longispora fulva]MBG6136010.1 hypothetical protein [Longispora fulva]GIG55749.1 hypothetical protein Lfu02_01210 [Longispora fulva]
MSPPEPVEPRTAPAAASRSSTRVVIVLAAAAPLLLLACGMPAHGLSAMCRPGTCGGLNMTVISAVVMVAAATAVAGFAVPARWMWVRPVQVLAGVVAVIASVSPMIWILLFQGHERTKWSAR